MQKYDYKKIIVSFIFCLSIIIIFTQAIFYVQKKSGYYLDEALTFQLANIDIVDVKTVASAIKNDNFDETKAKLEAIVLGTNSWVEHDEIMDEYVVRRGEGFNYLSTLLMQASDVHPPLYYYVIKTMCSIFPDMDLMLVGFIVNAILLLLALIFVYKLGMLIFDNKLYSIVAMLYYGLSYSFVNNVIYFRMYAFLTFWMVFSLYLNLQWFRNGFPQDKKNIIKLCVVEYFAMLTQYFAVFFCLPIFVLNIILLKKKNVAVSKYVKYNIITGFIYLITWPFSVYHILFTNRGGDVRGKLGGLGFLRNFLNFNHVLWDGAFSSSKKYLLAFVLLMVVLLVYKFLSYRKQEALKEWTDSESFGTKLYMVIVAFAYYFITTNAAPWVTDRYVMPVMPVISIIIVYVLTEAFAVVLKNKNIIALILAAFTFVLCLHWHQKLTPSFLYNEPARMEYSQLAPNYEAVIIDKEYEVCNPEIELNFEHPRIFETNDANVEVLKDNLKHDKTYMLYISDVTDVEHILDELEADGYTMKELDFRTDYYRIFEIDWRNK